MQDIYYHRPRGLSTVFARKFKIFFAKQKRFFCPLRAAAGGPFFRPQTDCLLAPPCALWDAPCGLRCPHAACDAPMRPCGAPMRPCGAPCAPWGYPTRSALPCAPPAALRRITPPQYRARLSPASQQLSPPPRGGPFPRPAAALCPAPPRTAEKKPGRSFWSGRALFISLSGDEAQVSDQALGLPNWQSLLPESEVHISSMFRGSL